MKHILLIVGLLFSITSIISQSPATPGTCYATTGNRDGGRLLSIDPNTGTGTLIADIPGINAASGLAIDSDGNIYGSDVTDPFNSMLIRIDAVTGAATLIGNTGLIGMDAIAFDENNILYGTQSLGFDQIYRINTTTAVPTLVGSMGISFTAEVTGLAFDPTDGILYGSTGGPSMGTDGLYTINTITGVATFIGVTGFGGSTPDIFFDQAGNLYGSKGGGGGGPNNLISINKATGAGSIIGPIGFIAVSGLACFPLQSVIPTMGEWGLVILSLLFFVIGIVVLRQYEKQRLKI